MTPENFDVLLGLIAVDITKNNTNMCYSIPANVKLAVTIRYLATGDSNFDLQYQFGIHASTFSKLIPEVYDALMPFTQG